LRGTADKGYCGGGQKILNPNPKTLKATGELSKVERGALELTRLRFHREQAGFSGARSGVLPWLLEVGRFCFPGANRCGGILFTKSRGANHHQPTSNDPLAFA
jgi:hypothetical protein